MQNNRLNQISARLVPNNQMENVWYFLKKFILQNYFNEINYFIIFKRIEDFIKNNKNIHNQEKKINAN